jgi:hypothetical protein
MKFSPLKRNIVLLIIKDHEMAEVIDVIKVYLNITTEQVFHIIDFFIYSSWVNFEEGKLMITYEGNNILKQSKLNNFSLKSIDEYKFKVKEDLLENYIPKKI